MATIHNLRMCAIGLFIAAMTSGCKTYQDVSPLFDSAISNFETAQDLTGQAISTDHADRDSQVNSVFGQLAKQTKEHLRVVIRSGWDVTKRDFKSVRGWTAWFGSVEFDDRSRDQFRSRFHLYLNREFEYKDEDGSAKQAKAHKIYMNYGGDLSRLSPKPNEESKRSLSRAYKVWRADFERITLEESPVFRSVAVTWKAALERSRREKTRRAQRNKRTYSNLIELARIGKAQAAELTSNAAFIALANRLAELGNQVLSGLSNSTKTK